jgi:hypothetical protein
MIAYGLISLLLVILFLWYMREKSIDVKTSPIPLL